MALIQNSRFCCALFAPRLKTRNMPIFHLSPMVSRKDIPAEAKKQPPRKWKWKKIVENE